MDVFSSTFHTAAEAGSVSLPTANRHLSIFKNCVDQDDPAVLVARCTRSGPLSAGCHLLLTERRLVVIRQTWPLRRLRLHLIANLRHLCNVNWRLDLAKPAVELSATAMDGERERFRMRLGSTDAVWRAEELLQRVFEGRRGEQVAVAGRASRRPAPAVALA
ncbi:hypothetical protein AB0F81_00765 [Actinoplanes sp. NPDC024001]|uniref:hypothetical protein n=1 Tax=Actinoplanes sp. NPDC024001 TaxID=3154598 RepID=UPI0033D3BD23